MNLNFEKQNNKKEKDIAAPLLIEELAARKDIAPEIKQLEPLTLKQIAKREGVELENLEDHLKTKISQFFEEVRENIFVWDDKFMPLMDTLYNLFLHSQSSKLLRDLPWLNKFENCDNFINYFYPKANNYLLSKLKSNLQHFLEAHVHPERQLKIIRWESKEKNMGGNEVYLSQGEWILLPERSARNYYEFLEKSVVKEIIEILKSGYREPDYSHGCGSAALAGIERHKAILSAREANTRGEKIKTGEFVSYISPEDQRSSSGGESGLRSVYASRGGPSYGYYILNWFNEYHVSFGINKERQEEFLDQESFSYNEPNEPKSLHQDWGGEGVLIGDQVPTKNFDLVYCWKVYEKEMKNWVKQNCPQAKVISLEAQEAMTRYNNIINTIALQQGITPIEVWQRLMENKI